MEKKEKGEITELREAARLKLKVIEKKTGKSSQSIFLQKIILKYALCKLIFLTR